MGFEGKCAVTMEKDDMIRMPTSHFLSLAQRKGWIMAFGPEEIELFEPDAEETKWRADLANRGLEAVNQTYSQTGNDILHSDVVVANITRILTDADLILSDRDAMRLQFHMRKTSNEEKMTFPLQIRDAGGYAQTSELNLQVEWMIGRGARIRAEVF